MGVQILVDGEGLTELYAVDIPDGTVIREVVVEVAAKGGFSPEEAFLFVEDDGTPIELDIVVDENYDRRRVHHVHRAKTIEVVVNYARDKKAKHFPPSARVEGVLIWAIGPDGFNIDPAIAPEMELALEGQTEELPGTAHIGRYVWHHRHCLELTLIRGEIMNGAKS